MEIIKNKKLLGRQVLLLLLDIILVNLAAYLPLYFRYEFSISSIKVQFLENVTEYTTIQTIVMLGLFWMCHLYSSLWRYASVDELLNVLYACSLGVILHFIGMHLCGMYMPRSYFPMELLFMIFLVGASRFGYRFMRSIENINSDAQSQNKIMIIGAGEAANMIIKEIHNSQYLDGTVACAIDDNKEKVNRYIQGIKVVGDRYDIVSAARKYHITDIIIAIPTLARKDQKQIIEYCKETGCRLKILPGIYQLINEEVSVSRLRNVEIEDLLGRDPIKLNTEKIMGYVTGKVVLVTGGGGSIGSELCRQVAKYRPKQLIIFDIYENNAYDIEQELKMSFPELDLVVLIGSIRNEDRLIHVFEEYRPELVYHAAAHKHVPLMETSPNEAIKNNVAGTLNLARVSDRFNVHRFVQISTDKAVNPTNVMGASKRMCEMIIQAYNKRSETEFVAVRFGNVLGSNGSVIPLFKRQIMQGGPVTLTHPDIIRYFMTISEAVSLVLEAGAIAKGGEIFVLDMGEPVKIADLAENLIRLSGYVPGRDIQIKYIGLRPGEKLYEELLMDEEGLQNTENSLIHIGKPIQFDEEKFFEQLDRLFACAQSEGDDVRDLIREIVPTYARNQADD